MDFEATCSKCYVYVSVVKRYAPLYTLSLPCTQLLLRHHQQFPTIELEANKHNASTQLTIATNAPRCRWCSPANYRHNRVQAKAHPDCGAVPVGGCVRRLYRPDRPEL